MAQNFSQFPAVFRKIWQNVGAPPGGLAPLLRGILNLPLTGLFTTAIYKNKLLRELYSPYIREKLVDLHNPLLNFSVHASVNAPT